MRSYHLRLRQASSDWALVYISHAPALRPGWYQEATHYCSQQSSNQSLPKDVKPNNATTNATTSNQNQNQTPLCPPPTGNNTSSTNFSPVHQDLPAQRPHHETHRPDRAMTSRGTPAVSAQRPAHTNFTISHQRQHQHQQLVERQTTDVPISPVSSAGSSGSSGRRSCYVSSGEGEVWYSESVWEDTDSKGNGSLLKRFRRMSDGLRDLARRLSD